MTRTWTQRFLLFVFGSAVVACAELPTSVASGPFKLKQPRPSHSYSYREGGLLYVQDENGYALTMDVPGQKITYSDGREMTLSTEQAANFANTFVTVIDSDANANTIDAEPPCIDLDTCYEMEALTTDEVLVSSTPVKAKKNAVIGVTLLGAKKIKKAKKK